MPVTASTTAEQTRLTIASYNIRYAVGSHLISSGLLRRVGLNPPQPRTARVAENIKTASRVFADGVLLPPVDILALQEADKRTGRAGGHHVARELAEQLQIGWVHVAAGIPRGVKPKDRQWWLNFEEPISTDDPGDTGVALLSHLPLEDITRIDLPWHECPWRPRLAMSASLWFAHASCGSSTRTLIRTQPPAAKRTACSDDGASGRIQWTYHRVG
jgi:endonuclease/exonuclease/phosphatase family metal-dependent hydrolase